jgi:hypothetical protein
MIQRFNSTLSSMSIVHNALIILIISSSSLFAQPLNPNTPVPLDGGLVTLLVAGAAYGVKKLKASRK